MTSESLKVCVITTVSITLKAFLIDQLVYLSKHGFRTTVVCDNDPEFAAICPKELNYVPIHMTRNSGVLSTLLSLWALYRFFKREKFDMIQYSTPKAAFISSLAGIMAGIPVRLYCQWGIRYVGFEGIFRKVFKLLEKLTCLFSTDIAPDSRGNLDFSVGEGLYPYTKAAVVHKGSANGVNLEKFNISFKDIWCKHIRSDLQISQDSFVFGFVGRITRDKGINELVSAFLNLAVENRCLSLLLVGDREENHGLTADVVKAIDTNPCIYAVGHKDNPQEYIAAMDLVVLPSYREGFGIVAIEAQALGLPVITSDIPGPREAVVNGKTGIIVPAADVEKLITAMKELAENRILLIQMGENAHQFVIQNFEQKDFWERVLEHRRKLLIK